MKREFTAVFQKRDKWYVAYVEEIPGVNTQGRTLKEARANLKEALQLIIEANRQLETQPLPFPSKGSAAAPDGSRIGGGPAEN